MRRLVDVTSLSPLAVAPKWQRRGIGSALIRRGLQELDERGVPLVFLEGDPRYYFRVTGTFVYSNTFWRHDCVGVRDKNA